jgi:hypothetical protein
MTLYLIIMLIMAASIGLGLSMDFALVLCGILGIVGATFLGGSIYQILGIMILLISIMFLRKFFLNN